MKANIIEEVGLLLYNSCKNIRGAFSLQFEYQLWGKHWPSPNPYKKNRVSFSILRQIVRSPFSSADTYVNQMKKRNSEKLERWAQEISLTSLTICLFSLTKQAIRLAPSSTNVSCAETSNHMIVVNKSKTKWFITKTEHAYIATSRSNSAKSLRVLICIHRI